jgi:hypothetical protein
MLVRAVGVLFAIVSGGCASQNLGASQPSLLSSKDENIARVLTVKEYGVVITDVEVYRGGTIDCYSMSMQVALAGERKPTSISGNRVNSIAVTSGADTILPPGDYVVRSITCGQGERTYRYNGPHATFTVRAGEIVNIGVLRLDVESEGFDPRVAKTKRSIGEPSPEVMVLLQRDIPQSWPKVVKRPMVLLGSAEGQAHRRF